MKSDPIRTLLAETDEKNSLCQSSNVSDLTDRILKIRGKRGNIRRISAVVLLAISISTLLIIDHKTVPPPQQLVLKNKPALQGRVEIEQELRDLQKQVEANDQILRHLNAIQTLSRAEAEIARLQSRDLPEQEITERAASAVVYQTDRMYRSTGQSASAIQAYREVIEHFPGTPSAELAKQRVTDIERAG